VHKAGQIAKKQGLSSAASLNNSRSPYRSAQNRYPAFIQRNSVDQISYKPVLAKEENSWITLKVNHGKKQYQPS